VFVIFRKYAIIEKLNLKDNMTTDNIMIAMASLTVAMVLYFFYKTITTDHLSDMDKHHNAH
jgi:hypothetical protein